MILRMRATRYWPLGAALALCAAALFAGGALRTGPLTWLGGGALVAIVRCSPSAARRAAACACCRWRRSRRGAPSRSGGRRCPTPPGTTRTGRSSTCSSRWSGLWLAGRTREPRGRARGLLAAVAVWALLGKVIPTLPGDYSTTVAGPSIARLRGPAGLWNQLALLGDFALPLALWIAGRRRIAGSLLAFVWLVALLLTYSRGGLAVAVLVVAAWFIWRDERLDAFGALVAAGLPAAAVVGVAFALPGITSDGQSLHTRRHDGLVFGVAAGRRPARDRGARRGCRSRGRARPAARAARRSARRRRGRDRRRGREGRRRVAQLHELGRGRQRRRPHRLGGLELPLGLVAAGLAGVHATTRSRGRAPGRSRSPTCCTAAARPTP